MNPAPFPTAIGPVPVIDRTCFRCLAEFPTTSADRRVFCPDCRAAYGFPAPSVPGVVATETTKGVA
jgi:hypothetical protein